MQWQLCHHWAHRWIKSEISQNINEFHTEVNRAMEILHKAVGENPKNNKILKNNMKDVSLSVECQFSQLRLVDMWNILRTSIILRAIRVT